MPPKEHPLPLESKTALHGSMQRAKTCTTMQIDCWKKSWICPIEYPRLKKALPPYVMRNIHMRWQAINGAIADNSCPEHQKQLKAVYRKLVIEIDGITLQQENMPIEEPPEE